MIQLIKGDCLVEMQNIPDKSIDAIICDLPYGTTTCKWDTVIPFEPLWKQYERIIKNNGAIVLTASQPFTTDLIQSNRKLFKYELIWEKTLGTNPMLTKKQPFKKHENICIFYKKQPTYNPQMTEGKPYIDKARESGLDAINRGIRGMKKSINNSGVRYPSSVQRFSNGNNGNMHPTQKPIALFEYLINTYTNEGETVLDNTMGSGTTGVACKQLNRSFIGIEMDDKYFDIAIKRINEAQRSVSLFSDCP